MKILEVCPYSAGGCGVWARAKQESIELSKRGYEVKIFSTNKVKDSDKTSPEHEGLGKISIQRFPATKLGGESFMSWDFEKEALKFNPDIIMTHNYRHLHTTKCLKIAKKLKKKGHNCKVFLVTHAPFVEGNITRSLLSNIIVKFYDKFIGPKTLNKFDKILAISHWEIPYLLKYGARKYKIIYIPNGIPEEFFTQKPLKESNKILFLGRIARKKKLETLISAIPYIKDKSISIEFVGPKDKEYYEYLKSVIKKLKVEKKIKFSVPVYNLNEKIKKIDSAKIFVLPSRVEGMPQSLIEAMARNKIVVGSNSIAIRDIIKDKKNGYLFDFNNPKDLANKINLALELNKTNRNIKLNARKFVKTFRWSKIIKQLESLF